VHAPDATRRCFLRSLLATAAVVLGSGEPAEAAAKAGDRARRVTLGDLTGGQVTLPDAYAGKVVIVHFWASWCPACLREIEVLESLFGEYRERGVAPVSINVGETRAAVLEALRNRKVSYAILLDPDSATARLYGVRGVPTTFVVDRAGAIGVRILGEIDRRGLQEILAGLQ
jgi:cytochrome c biogenesis protein CcmG, thiol:disulfide interchange protein DsbE